MTAKPTSLIEALNKAKRPIRDVDQDLGFNAGIIVAKNIMRDHFASPEVAACVTDAIKREAFALEGFPVKALFAENLLGKAALKAAVGEDMIKIAQINRNSAPNKP
jgi:hypothetical protein